MILPIYYSRLDATATAACHHVPPCFPLGYELSLAHVNGPEALRVLVYSGKSHVAETAPFLTPPLDLDENEHASRRISTPLITMGVIRIPCAAPFDVLM